jgi:hypothetical protein
MHNHGAIRTLLSSGVPRAHVESVLSVSRTTIWRAKQKRAPTVHKAVLKKMEKARRFESHFLTEKKKNPSSEVTIEHARRTWVDWRTVCSRKPSHWACRQYLKSRGYSWKRLVPGVLLTEEDKVMRVKWCKGFEKKTCGWWEGVLFIDNASFQVQTTRKHVSQLGGQSRRGFWGRINEKMRKRGAKLKFNTGKVKKLFCMSYKGKLSFVAMKGRFNGTKAAICYKKAQQWAIKNGHSKKAKIKLIEDRCPVYRAKKNHELKSRLFSSLELPTRSPDLNAWDRTLFGVVKHRLNVLLTKKAEKSEKWTEAEYMRLLRSAFAFAQKGAHSAQRKQKETMKAIIKGKGEMV